MQLGVVSGLIALLGSGEDAAAAEIQVDGPRSCSRAAELRTRVEHALGRSLDALGDVSCRVHVVRDGGSYAARVELSSTGQARSLHSFSAKTCPKLMDTLELALVLSVGADGGAGAGDASGQRVSAAFAAEQAVVAGLAPPRQRERAVREAARSVPLETAWVADASLLAKEAPVAKAPVAFAAPLSPAMSVERASARTSTDALGPSAALASTGSASADYTPAEPAAESRLEREALWRALGGLVLDAGALPGPALGAQLGGSFGSAIELRVFGTYLLPTEATFAAPGGGSDTYGIDFALATAALLGCAPRLARSGSVELGVCAGGELGVLWSGQSDLTRSRSSEWLWSALRADVGVRWEVAPSWLGIDTRLGVSAPLSRPQFTVEALGGNPTDVYRPSAIGGRLSVAATFALDGSR